MDRLLFLVLGNVDAGVFAHNVRKHLVGAAFTLVFVDVLNGLRGLSITMFYDNLGRR